MSFAVVCSSCLGLVKMENFGDGDWANQAVASWAVRHPSPEAD